MKPTTKQIRVIEFLKQQLDFWKNSKDIGSPTHIGDIGEFSNHLDDILSKKELMEVDLFTHELYVRILEIK